MKKIFISPERRPYPHGIYAYGDTDEHTECYSIADLVRTELLILGFTPFIAPASWALAQRTAHANANGFDYYLCIHTNAGGGTGTECLYYNHPASIRANQLVYDRLTGLYPSKRGIKDYSHFYENNKTNMVSCYPEIAFHDNKKDAEFIVKNKAEIAKALAYGVAEYFGVTPKDPQPDTPDEEVEMTVTLDEYKAILRERDKLQRDYQILSDEHDRALNNLELYQDELRALKENNGDPEKIKELERKLDAIADILK